MIQDLGETDTLVDDARQLLLAEPPSTIACRTPQHTATCTTPYTVLPHPPPPSPSPHIHVPTIPHELINSVLQREQEANVCSSFVSATRNQRVTLVTPHTTSKPGGAHHLPITSTFAGHTSFSAGIRGPPTHATLPPPSSCHTPPPLPISSPAAPRVSTAGGHAWRPLLAGRSHLRTFCPCQCQCQQKKEEGERGRVIDATISPVLAACNYTHR